MDIKKAASRIRLLALDFDGVLTNNKVIVNEKGEEAVICDRSDGYGIYNMINPSEIEAVVISLERNRVVEARCRKLEIEYFPDVRDKLLLLKKICSEKKISLEEVCYVGNDVTDIGCIENAGLGACPADADARVKEKADYVAGKKGGDGAVREICELLLATGK
jgi:YrbI family 3-deoxy-D-manno-octulosonate 8-phosphate phosphatase